MIFNFLFFLLSSRLNRYIYTIKINSILNTDFSSNKLIKNNGNFNQNNTDGFDTRNTYNNTDINFYELFTKKQLLDDLLNNDLSIVDKLELLKDNEIRPPNLLAGGLFKDWEFN